MAGHRQHHQGGCGQGNCSCSIIRAAASGAAARAVSSELLLLVGISSNCDCNNGGQRRGISSCSVCSIIIRAAAADGSPAEAEAMPLHHQGGNSCWASNDQWLL